MEIMQKTWPKYLEVKHEEHVNQVKDEFLMMRQFKISVEGDFNCPAKTIALFAHNEEFSYGQDEMPSIVKQVSEECKTISGVQKLIQQGVIPSMISGDGVKIDIDSLYSSAQPQRGLIGSQIIFFDPKNKRINQQNKGVRLIAWISTFRALARLDDVDAFFPKPITTKFITASFIESENLIHPAHRDLYPDPNVDCAFIKFFGHRLKVPAEYM